VSIKWPNDIYINKQKVSGILIKNYICGTSIEASIIGIGINVNQFRFPPDLPNPTSLARSGNQNLDTSEVLKVFIRSMQFWYSELQNKPTNNISQKYLKDLYQLEIQAPYLINKEKIKAKITGLDEYGKLRLIGENGTEYLCDLSEIRFL
jgi:BirA family biotin operon repressor/biotin-[acetyl-CoA-carboxylase] ligase